MLDLACEVVLHLAHVQVAVAHQVEQLRRVCREVCLDGEQRVVIVLAEAVHLPRIRVLVVLVAQRADLLARDVVEHLPDKIIASVARRVAADDIGPPRYRLFVDRHRAVRIAHPRPALEVYAVLLDDVFEVAAPRLLRPLDDEQPLAHLLRVEHRLARHTPLSEAIDLVVVLVRLFEGFERRDGLRRQKAVVEIRALVHRRARVLAVEKPLFQPMCDADRVERQDHLQVIGEVCSQSNVQLVEVLLFQLACFLDPYPRDVVDRLELFRVVESGEEDLAAVCKRDAHVAFVDLRPALRVVVRDLPAQLLKAALAQRLRDLSAYEPAVPRLACHALEHLAPREDRLAAAAAAFQDEVAVPVEQQRQEVRVVRRAEVPPPQRHLKLSLIGPRLRRRHRVQTPASARAASLAAPRAGCSPPSRSLSPARPARPLSSRCSRSCSSG